MGRCSLGLLHEVEIESADLAALSQRQNRRARTEGRCGSHCKVSAPGVAKLQGEFGNIEISHLHFKDFNFAQVK